MAITLVMYHYVRDPVRTRYPGIKACSIDAFRRQLDSLSAAGPFLGIEDLLAALRGETVPDGTLLTFDDGFLDHYLSVFPVLHDRKISGLFFPPSRPILDGRMLDVHKIHLILAAEPDHSAIARDLMQAIDNRRQEWGLASAAHYWQQYAVANRFDPAETIFVKRLLQHALPESLRHILADELFARHVSRDEAAIAAEWYMSPDQLRTMITSGQYVGGHGENHTWLDRLSDQEQAQEVAGTVNFLDQIGAPTQDWIMCYPFGSHDERLHSLLAKAGCAAGLATTIGRYPGGSELRWQIPRLDTNDIAPFSSVAGA